MFEIIRIPAFKDNYIWLLRKGASAVAVDPGDAQPVIDVLTQTGLSLRAVFVTHHHQDHQGGVADLVRQFPVPVFGPAAESITAVTHPLPGGERIHCDALDCEVEVLSTPGHTAGHLSYLACGCLFCGDTLFAGGCGRVFEGSPRQLYDSLRRLSALPDDTRVFCAHEYTESNLRFALAVEPGNSCLRDRIDEVAEIRGEGLATLPSTMILEKQTNPFLRCSEPEVVASARMHGARSDDPVEVFAALREWKNRF